MTGQVEFDSHIGAIVLLATDLVNVLTPGESGGRPFSPPEGRAAVPPIEAALRRYDWVSRTRLTAAEAGDLAAAARRLRAVFEAVSDDEAGRVDRT
jgi:hypothetical protein